MKNLKASLSTVWPHYSPYRTRVARCCSSMSVRRRGRAASHPRPPLVRALSWRPVLDTIFTGLEVARVVYAASADDSVYENPNQPLSRGTDVALGLGFTALFLGSSLYGYTATRNCRKYQEENDHASEHEWESGPAGARAARNSPPTWPHRRQTSHQAQQKRGPH